MYRIKFTLLFLLLCLLSGACSDFEIPPFTLDRNNPRDENNSNRSIPRIDYAGYDIVSDNNNDGIINKGETIYMKVALANNGTGTANAVKATFTIEKFYIPEFLPASPVEYGDIPAGGTRYGIVSGQDKEYTIKFTVSAYIPTGIYIPISINTIDGNKNTWTGSFYITVF